MPSPVTTFSTFTLAVAFFTGSGCRSTPETQPPPMSPAMARTIAHNQAPFMGAVASEYMAVRDGAPRCVDGVTACTIANEATDCSGQTPPRCTPNGPAHGVILNLSPKVLASAEPGGALFKKLPAAVAKPQGA